MSGGAPVLHYRVTWDQGTGVFVTLEDEVLQQSYTATGLSASVTYVFKVQAKNSFGYSDFSETVSILSAQTPNIPSAPTTSFVGSDLIVSWTPPVSGGSPITAYNIQIRHSDGVTFSQELTACDGSSLAVV